MRQTFEIAVFEGDGVGPEIMHPTVDLLTDLSRRAESFALSFQSVPAGAAHYRATGQALPGASLAKARSSDAVLLSAMGLPDVRYPDGTEISPQIDLRMELGLFAGVRPVFVRPGQDTPLKTPRTAEIDFVIVRESTEGLFASHGKGVVEDDRVARETLEITRATSEKLFDFAFDLARRREAEGKGRGIVHCVDKANVFQAFAFFRRIFSERASGFPEIRAETAYVDAAALWMVQKPWMFDVIVTENMFGDILSDLGAGIMGSLGLAPSADIGEKNAVFQPCHGSAPDIAGLGVANPMAMILSAAMMLDWLGHRHDNAEARAAGSALDAAVTQVLSDGRVLPAESRRIGHDTRSGRSDRGGGPRPISEMNAALSVATVGAGYFAAFHVKSWVRNPETRLVGLADLDPHRAMALAETMVGSAVGLEVSTDAEGLLARLRPDIVDIAAPSTAHFALIATALQHRPKAIICQKPFCSSMEEAVRAVDLAEASGVPLIVHENFRFQPWYRILRSEIDAGRVGDLFQITFRLRPGDGQGGNAYLDRQPYFQRMERFLVHETAVHWIDTFRFLMGEPNW